MAEQAKIMTLHDHDTGEAIAPRTDIKALSGEGKKWNYVGFTEDNVIGVVEGTWPCNKNLLDNWYFVGGGSQQGDGQFPVNQRGGTTYTTDGYCIDRWRFITNGGEGIPSVKIETDGAIVTGATNINTAIMQIIDKKMPLDQDLTLSVLVDSVEGEVWLNFSQNNAPWTLLGSSIIKYGLTSLHVKITQENADETYQFTFSIASNASLKIKAAKLELGSQQTLAHQENGVWVLNEIPDHGTELAKCQRYFVRFPEYSTCGISIINAHDTDREAKILISLPVELNRNPTIEITNGGYFILTRKHDYYASESVNPIPTSVGASSILISVEFSQSQIAEMEPYTYLAYPQNGDLIIDANL